MALQKDGASFVGWLLVPKREDLVFKFVVNGEWLVSQDYSVDKDENGNENNKVVAGDLLTSKTVKSNLAEIPANSNKTAEIAKPTEPAERIEKSASTTTITAPADAAAVPTSGVSKQFETPAPSENSEAHVHTETEPISLPLTHVETTSSSFAGVSISADSAFENVQKEEIKPKLLSVEKELDHEDDAHEFDTPTNSIVNTPGTPKKGEIHIPGAFPSSSTTSSNVPLERKEAGLIAKFKSLFR